MASNSTSNSTRSIRKEKLNPLNTSGLATGGNKSRIFHLPLPKVMILAVHQGQLPFLSSLII